MTTGRIVVGVDGSDGSLAALRWAVEEARLRDAGVEAIHAWHFPYIEGLAAYANEHELEQAARRVLDDALAALGGLPGEMQVEGALVHGTAASALLACADGADLLVVGSRGHGGFMGLLLGSVSQQCVQHSPCPVVVVPTPSGS